MPQTIRLTHLKCFHETNEVGSDEPYVLVTACRLVGSIPQVEVTLYGPFAGVDQGETHHAPMKRFWGLQGDADNLPSASSAVFIVSLLEHDNGNPDATRMLAKIAATASLAASSGMTLPHRINKLRTDINDILKLPTGAPNFDDIIGTNNLPLSSQDVNLAKDIIRTIEMNFAGDGGNYRLFFECRGF